MKLVTGSVLRAECVAWCERTGTSMERLSCHAGRAYNFVAQLGGRFAPSGESVVQLRAVMATYPEGIPAGLNPPSKRPTREVPAPAPQQSVLSAAEAAVRERAPRRRRSAEYLARLSRASQAETVATRLVETPADLIATVKRTWPDQWRRIVERARVEGTLPGAMLAQVIERGLEAGA